MSLYLSPAIRPTPGLAYEAFNPRLRNPMLPQQAYRRRAAGPEFLAMDGDDRTYMAVLRSRNPVNLRGLGLDVNQLFGDQFNQMIDAAIERSWPKIQVKLNESLKPVMYLLGAAVLLSATAATMSYLSWSSKRA